jgi:GT2 family glycosyltransferase
MGRRGSHLAGRPVDAGRALGTRSCDDDPTRIAADARRATWDRLSRRPSRKEPIESVPLVSVVIPTHDRRPLATLAIRSAIWQRDVDVEVIVVDDGSIDGTTEAVRSLFPDVRLVRHQTALGVATARNAGIAASRGKWVALLDDDDLWSPDKIVRQLEAARHAKSEWAYAGAVEIDEMGRSLGGAPPPSPEQLLSGLSRENLMPAGCSNVIVTAELMSRVGGFEPALRHLADWDLWFRLARHGTPACVSEPLVAYRVHRAQASMDTSGMLEEARLLEHRYGAHRTSILRWIAWSYLRHGERWDAVRAYGQAVRAGDLVSVGRALLAAVSPDAAMSLGRGTKTRSGEWGRTAREWIRDASAEGAR